MQSRLSASATLYSTATYSSQTLFSSVRKIACVHRIHLECRCLMPAILFGEGTGLGSDPLVIRACRSSLEMINSKEEHKSLPARKH